MEWLVINAGSTSTKLVLHAAGGMVRQQKVPAEQDCAAAIDQFLAGRTPGASVHRIVHGGPELSETTVVDESVLRRLDSVSAIAPLHNPVALRWLEAARRRLPDLPHIAVFDTGFFRALPEVAARYALPTALCDRLAIRRYGFHGIAHRALYESWRSRRPEDNGGRLVTFQLGGGASVAAIDRGRPVDTSMGFSPLEGLVMRTRCGDLDPGIVPYLVRQTGMDFDAIETLLNRESGLRGVSGSSGDMAELLQNSSRAAELAVELFCYRAKKYLGAYAAVLGGLDGVVFGGGIGENAPEIRARILADFAFLNVSLNEAANRAARGGEAVISAPASGVEVCVFPVDEAALMVREAEELLERH